MIIIYNVVLKCQIVCELQALKHYHTILTINWKFK